MQKWENSYESSNFGQKSYFFMSTLIWVVYWSKPKWPILPQTGRFRLAVAVWPKQPKSTCFRFWSSIYNPNFGTHEKKNTIFGQNLPIDRGFPILNWLIGVFTKFFGASFIKRWTFLYKRIPWLFKIYIFF